MNGLVTKCLTEWLLHMDDLGKYKTLYNNLHYINTYIWGLSLIVN